MPINRVTVRRRSIKENKKIASERATQAISGTDRRTKDESHGPELNEDVEEIGSACRQE